MSRTRNGWVLPVSLLLALLLGLVPLPPTLQPMRPYWLALVLAYWVLEEPQKIGLGMAFIVQRFRAQLRFFPLSQQAVAIGVLLLNDRVVSLVIHLVLGAVQLPWTYWVAPLLGLVLWAPLYLVLDALRLNRGS